MARWELDPEAWQTIEDGQILRLEVVSGDKEPCHSESDASCGTAMDVGDLESDLDLSDPVATEEPVNIVLVTLTGRRVRLQIKVSKTVKQLKDLFYDNEGVPPADQRIIFRGRKLCDSMRLEERGITEGAELQNVIRLRGGKPAIYFMQPPDLEDDVRVGVTVTLTLCSDWRFSILYPPADIMKDVDSNGYEDTVIWEGSLKRDGTIHDDHTRLDCSYLFWEAESLPLKGDLPSMESLLILFNPGAPHAFLQHAHEILPFDKLVERLDQVLEEFCLTVAMRTDFMVYWLPAFQRLRNRGQHIKFSFVPQIAFSMAARLDIDIDLVTDIDCKPARQTTGRVFMLFSGVDASFGPRVVYCACRLG
ncbi:NEDD8 precursor-ubiquitin-like protein [Apiospora arundinis]